MLVSAVGVLDGRQLLKWFLINQELKLSNSLKLLITQYKIIEQCYEITGEYDLTVE